MTVRQATRVGSRQTTWYVQSETNPSVEYIVHNKRDAVSHRPRWTCNCPDFTERQQFVRDGVCKHIVSAQMFKARQVLDTLVRVLNQNNDDSKALWDVLSALRGPDNSDYNLKLNTTSTLRSALGIKYTGIISNRDRALGADSNDSCDIIRMVNNRFGAVSNSGHFAAHYANAIIALKRLGYIK